MTKPLILILAALVFAVDRVGWRIKGDDIGSLVDAFIMSFLIVMAIRAVPDETPKKGESQ